MDPDELIPYIGPPLIGSFQGLHGLSLEEAHRAVDYYREHFSTIGLYENELDPGIIELLAELHGRGQIIILATSKPTVFAERILDHFGLTPYFDLIVGSNLDHTRVDKREVIGHVLSERPVIARDRVVMVGDREHDVFGARHHGIPTIGVAYGYGGVAELTAAGALAIAHSISELKKLLSGD